MKVDDSEIKTFDLCLVNILKDLTVDNIKKNGFYGYIYDFSVTCDNINISHITNIHKYLMNKYNIV